MEKEKPKEKRHVFQLVPVIPTAKMLEAGEKAWKSKRGLDLGMVWDAMLAEAPEK